MPPLRQNSFFNWSCKVYYIKELLWQADRGRLTFWARMSSIALTVVMVQQ